MGWGAQCGMVIGDVSGVLPFRVRGGGVGKLPSLCMYVARDEG